MATLSFEVMTELNELHDIALLEDDFGTAHVYSLAADLTDAMLKGRGSGAVPPLVDALRTNAGSDTEHAETWSHSASVVLRSTRRWLGWDKTESKEG